MLIQRSQQNGTERLLFDDSQAVVVLERDGTQARVLSWNDRNDERPTAALPAMGATCSSSCPRASQSVRPTPVELTIDRRRQDVHWWAMVLRIMAMRPEICARCSLLTRWTGLYWCGVPWPVRQWRRVFALASQVATWANVGDDDGGCGCCLNLKWRLLVSPRSMLRQLAAAIAWAITGEALEANDVEVACPYGLWPKAL